MDAVIVQRVEDGVLTDTDEIEALARSAGYSVVDILTQSRGEDTEYNVGGGKVAEIHRALRKTRANVVIFDNELDPYQTYNLGIYFPNNVTVLDRYTLILNIFQKRVDSRHGKLQVDLARLRYELPRAETKARLAKKDEKPGFMGLGEYDENEKKDIKKQISRIKSELDSIQEDREKRREQQRNRGSNLVSIAGYTNAGKSTLLRRLAEDHSVDENEALHDDLDTTAESTSDLFTTLDTLTRQMDFEKRDVLLTDTVGLISDLPHWLIESFRSTFDSVYESGLILLVVDSTNSVEDIREQIVSCHDVFDQRTETRIVTVFNKIDLIDESELDRKMNALQRIAPNSICVSAETGENIEELKDRVHKMLPPLRETTLQLPLSVEESMSVVSWIHDNAYVSNQEYTGESIILEFEARPWIAEKALSKAESLENAPVGAD